MASQQSTVEYLVSQIQDATVSTRKMFGEYALYCNGKVVGFMCDDRLFIKPTVNGKAYLLEPEMGYPYPGAKPYFLIAKDNWDDSEWLTQLIKITAKELPLPKQKR